MSKRSPRKAARLLHQALDKSVQQNEALDARIPDYVRAELAGIAVQDEYPDLHEYIMLNAQAHALYSTLRDLESKQDS